VPGGVRGAVGAATWFGHVVIIVLELGDALAAPVYCIVSVVSCNVIGTSECLRTASVMKCNLPVAFAAALLLGGTWVVASVA
jgi:hypothetical protein